MTTTISSVINWDGSNWVVTTGNGQGGVLDVSYSSGNLTVNHDFCPGTDFHIAPSSVGGSVFAPFIPLVKSPTSELCVLNFLDTLATTEGDATYTGASPSSRMAFQFGKTYTGPFKFNGTDGTYRFNLTAGNIWIIGFMYD